MDIVNYKTSESKNRFASKEIGRQDTRVAAVAFGSQGRFGFQY